MNFTASRQAGLERLAGFTPRARAYARLRNFDFGPNDRSNVSGLSPYLRHRLLTEMEVLAAALQAHSISAVEKFIDEVFWRAYFKGHLQARPEIWRRYCEDRDAAIVSLDDDPLLRDRYEAAVDGRTGIEGFDDWVHELLATGYLHNHARMWFASIWIFTLRLPWVLGADFTYRHFIDGDPASNTLSWRWVAGLHTPGKAYLARADNIERFTQGRFRPRGLADHAEALREPHMPAQFVFAPPLQLPVERSAVLVLSEDDLDTEGLWAEAGAERNMPPIAVGALAPALSGISPLPVPPAVSSFKYEALADAMCRASISWGAPAAPRLLQDARAIADWAESQGADTIILPFAPAGATADQRIAMVQSLHHEGFAVVETTRRYDRLTWPHTATGFFKLKARIPSILTGLGLPTRACDAQGDLFGGHHA